MTQYIMDQLTHNIFLEILDYLNINDLIHYSHTNKQNCILIRNYTKINTLNIRKLYKFNIDGGERVDYTLELVKKMKSFICNSVCGQSTEGDGIIYIWYTHSIKKDDIKMEQVNSIRHLSCDKYSELDGDIYKINVLNFEKRFMEYSKKWVEFQKNAYLFNSYNNSVGLINLLNKINIKTDIYFLHKHKKTTNYFSVLYQECFMGVYLIPNDIEEITLYFGRVSSQIKLSKDEIIKQKQKFGYIKFFKEGLHRNFIGYTDLTITIIPKQIEEITLLYKFKRLSSEDSNISEISNDVEDIKGDKWGTTYGIMFKHLV